MKETPMMKQYLGFKKQYPDKVVLFRMGDFYETFNDDAKLVSKVLNITLTTRDKKSDPTPLAGFPYHALDQYLPKLIYAGLNAVVVDQLEDPKLAKGVVKRGVTRVVTPGTLDGDLAADEKNPYIMTMYKDGSLLGVSLLDLSTGNLLVGEILDSKYAVDDLLSSYDPVELVVSDLENIQELELPIQYQEIISKNRKKNQEYILQFYGKKSASSIGIDRLSAGIFALSLMLAYVEDTQKMVPEHITIPKMLSLSNRMVLDQSTIRNLDLIENSTTGSKSESLLGIMDSTSTPMGKRLLYKWVLNPLIDELEIQNRLDLVEIFRKDDKFRDQISQLLEEVSDVDRIIGKIGLNRVNGRDLISLANSLERMIEILNISTAQKGFLEKINSTNELEEILNQITEAVEYINSNIVDEPPVSITDGGIINEGILKEVDELRQLSGSSKTWVKQLEEEEREKNNIPSLKVGFNKVFGYYLEVTKAHQDKVPEHYIRKQTLVNSERYITEELKEKEEVILNSQETIASLEYEYFQEVREELLRWLPSMRIVSEYVSQIDVFNGFAKNAIYNNYVKPEVFAGNEKGGILSIKGGRHPVVESLSDEPFIPNDTSLSVENNRMGIITGPNMAGKSTYIRQVALITLMTQIGSFVPADEVKISLADRVFSRVGASDDLAAGRSTFMVEMEEAANILNNATSNSLIILDEVGRGTSTYDGVSIAWSLVEYLVNEVKARTLFATHYHELTNLESENPELIRNYNVEVKEKGEEVIFLRNIIEGGTDQSYGIYVAQMAGLPTDVIDRANEIIQDLSVDLKNGDGEKSDSGISSRRVKSGEVQYAMFNKSNDKVSEELSKIDPNKVTPLEALEILAKLKEIADQKDK